MVKKKNITLSFSEDEIKKLDELVDYFQEHSITRVTRTDVFAFMFKRGHEEIVEKNTPIDNVLRF